MRFKSCLFEWKRNLLSNGERLPLIKSTMINIPISYIFFLTPVSMAYWSPSNAGSCEVMLRRGEGIILVHGLW